VVAEKLIDFPITYSQLSQQNVVADQAREKTMAVDTPVPDIEKSSGVVEEQSNMQSEEKSDTSNYLHGKRLHLLTIGYV
jgi:hypothetical protein